MSDTMSETGKATGKAATFHMTTGQDAAAQQAAEAKARAKALAAWPVGSRVKMGKDAGGETGYRGPWEVEGHAHGNNMRVRHLIGGHSMVIDRAWFHPWGEDDRVAILAWYAMDVERARDHVANAMRRDLKAREVLAENVGDGIGQAMHDGHAVKGS